MQESERGYTSLKAPARWESFSPPVACLKTSSVPWRLRRRQWRWRHQTKNASSFTQLLRLTSISLLLSFCWPRVGFDVFALLSDGICSLPMMLVPGEAWMRLVHSLEPKCREALRFPYFDTKFYSLSAEWQLPLAYIFVFEPVSPLAEMFIIYEWFVWLWVNFCFCCQ